MALGDIRGIPNQYVLMLNGEDRSTETTSCALGKSSKSAQTFAEYRAGGAKALPATVLQNYATGSIWTLANTCISDRYLGDRNVPPARVGNRSSEVRCHRLPSRRLPATSGLVVLAARPPPRARRSMSNGRSSVTGRSRRSERPGRRAFMPARRPFFTSGMGMEGMGMETLHEIGLRHNTDKATYHGYTALYAELLDPLRKTKATILELGWGGYGGLAGPGGRVGAHVG